MLPPDTQDLTDVSCLVIRIAWLSSSRLAMAHHQDLVKEGLEGLEASAPAATKKDQKAHTHSKPPAHGRRAHGCPGFERCAGVEKHLKI